MSAWLVTISGKLEARHNNPCYVGRSGGSVVVADPLGHGDHVRDDVPVLEAPVVLAGSA